MAKHIFFVTGTDTGVGKTTFVEYAIREFQRQGKKAVGLKPIASGAKWVDGKLQNEDAQILQRASSVQLDYSKINPIVFQPPIAPHLAALKAHTVLTVDLIMEKVTPLLELDVDVLFIEGAGGWLVPLNEHETLADFAKVLQVPVIVVAGMRLGVLNHTSLTVHAIQSQGVPCLGVVANELPPRMDSFEENLASLQSLSSCPYLGTLPAQYRDKESKDAINWSKFLRNTS